MKKLEWDSNFWDVDIYNIENNYDYYIPNSDESKNNKWLLQVLLPETNIKAINAFEVDGFRFVETKINLIKGVSNEFLDDRGFKRVKKKDIESYKNDFFNLFGRNSRFALFENLKVNEFYYTWLINSIDGKMDDTCIGYYIDNKLAGFITSRVKNNEFSIGLFGVFDQYRNKRIGHKLLNWINLEAGNNGYDSISVSTQGKNITAINTYIRNGYKFKSIENWYYLEGMNNDKI